MMAVGLRRHINVLRTDLNFRVRAMSTEAIESKLELGQARALDPAGVEDALVRDNPAIRALSDVERAAWLMARRGITQKDIGEVQHLRKDEVCRLLRAVADKIDYLARFQELILHDPELMHKFTRGQVCDHCDRHE